MTSRQHAPLVLIAPGEATRLLQPMSLQLGRGTGGYDEAWVRDLIFAHPEAVPLGEIDPAFGPLVPVCTELDTRVAGYADALFLNPLGMPTLVECKLWRNPEARREVVGQILDYARALRRWTYSDLQREAARARRHQGFDLFSHVRDGSGLADLDQAAFVDDVTRNLAQGRVLLLVLGDGVREGVEAIADYIQGTTGLHFTFGLVEAQVFDLGDGRRVVQPRILAKTRIINRTVVDLARPELVIVDDPGETVGAEPPAKSEPNERERWMKAFWVEMLAGLELDDAEQPPANPLFKSNIFFPLPGKRDIWLTCYFSVKQSSIGIFLGYDRTSLMALEVGRRLEVDRNAIDKEIGRPVTWENRPDGKIEIGVRKHYDPLEGAAARQDQIDWFRSAINAFVNVLRPRIGNLVRELSSTEGTPQ